MIELFQSRVNVAPEVLFKIVGEETVLLNLNTEAYLGLDPVGTRMWNLLTESTSIAAAYDVLISEYEVDPEQLRIDLQNFVGELLALGLVQIHGEGTANAGRSK
jgi:hypothetical protein